MTSSLDVTGDLGLASYTAMTMCVQFPDSPLGHEADFRFSLPPGRYQVEVFRLFDYEDGAQFTDADLSEGDAYVIRFRVSDLDPVVHDTVPWTRSP